MFIVPKRGVQNTMSSFCDTKYAFKFCLKNVELSLNPSFDRLRKYFYIPIFSTFCCLYINI